MIINFKEKIGQCFQTNEEYAVEIIDYVDTKNVLIKFVDRPDVQIWSTLQNIRNCQVKNPYHRTVYNKGYYGIGEYTARKNNAKTEEYIKWFSMFVRSYDEKYHEKQPTYTNCEVSEEFCNFQNFASWYYHYKYPCKYPLELDKDLLYEGNKIYSPSTCCLIPKEINATLNSKRHDPDVMSYIYQKYKMEVPYYIRTELCKLTFEKR